jgi:hypothetical protein
MVWGGDHTLMVIGAPDIRGGAIPAGAERS